MLGHEIWMPITGPSGSQQAVQRALNRCTLDFSLLKPGLLQGNEWSAPGKISIPVNVRSLANFAQEAEANGWQEGIDYHAIAVNPITGDLVDHEHGVDIHGITLAADVAPAVLGLFWFSGLVEVEEQLLTRPDLFDEVFHSEGAHATDFFYMLPTGKRDVAHALICRHNPRHAWFQPSPYFEMPGEGFMGIFVKAFTTYAVTLQGFSHPAIEPTVGLVKNLLVPIIEPPPPPPPPPPDPQPEIVEVYPGIWDARPVVSNPQGNGPMGALVGQATHHTVGALLPFDATIEQEVAVIKAIDAQHVAQGWGGFAYHGIAFASGRAYLCGDLGARRAHVANRNHELHGLAFDGDFSAQLPPEGMLRAGGHFLQYVINNGGSATILGHREWGTATACPGKLEGFNWTPYLEPEQPPPTIPYFVSFVRYDTMSNGQVWTTSGKYDPPPH